MKPQVRKGLHDIVTYRGMTTDENNPQRKFLAAASVELKKTLCDRVRAAARKRVVEMDRKIAELDAELDSLVGRRQRRRAEGGRPTTPLPRRRRAAGAARLYLEILTTD